MIELQIIQEIQGMISKRKWIRIIKLLINQIKLNKLLVFLIIKKTIRNMKMMI
jgi:hypothetical protein